ncbi:MAG: tRNA preQ1(34) S-adenosylmethionine ribosyltransferase-isomerase QueA [Tissierellia bacterium]|nr:tRNA preQ1(34) S-adenosylmethionine ribosyltransferase-isomerase QueA [Tissierellia bacterium]
MKTRDFYYDLPNEKIAQHPVNPRDHSKLLVMDRKTGKLKDKVFYEIIEDLHSGDVLVINNTKVRPARLFVHRPGKKEKIEILILNPTKENYWECLVKPGKKMRLGTKFQAGDILEGKVEEITDDGNRLISFQSKIPFEEALEILGEMPLPPYITEKLEEKDRYQTVYSKHLGSAAAPTAGLHFTESLMNRLKEKGISICPITLHVGLGTFRPVKVEDINNHKMHSEYYEISDEIANLINKKRKLGGRIIAVGTTSVRTLESMADETGTLQSGKGWTDIFIKPGYTFKIVDGLITNFHLPESTLLMLVSAFSSKEFIFAAYEKAKNDGYRFFSFGDAMFIK